MGSHGQPPPCGRGVGARTTCSHQEEAGRQGVTRSPVIYGQNALFAPSVRLPSGSGPEKSALFSRCGVLTAMLGVTCRAVVLRAFQSRFSLRWALAAGAPRVARAMVRAARTAAPLEALALEAACRGLEVSPKPAHLRRVVGKGREGESDRAARVSVASSSPRVALVRVDVPRAALHRRALAAGSPARRAKLSLSRRAPTRCVTPKSASASP